MDSQGGSGNTKGGGKPRSRAGSSSHSDRSRSGDDNDEHGGDARPFDADAARNMELRAQWETEQRDLKQKLVVFDDHDDWTVRTASGGFVTAKADPAGVETMDGLKYIGGVDISFVEGSNVDAIATLAILEYPSLEVVKELTRHVELRLPYIPGFLAFREVPHLVELFATLRAESPAFVPGVVLVDGNGILHPRGLGLASHLGVLVDVPTIGVAKNLHMIDGLHRDTVRDRARAELANGGDAFELIGESGKAHGWALRSTGDSKNPIFVSAGHRVSAETALGVTRALCKYRVPEPVRKADLISRGAVRKDFAAE
jgi:deoxyinosine 3'endonuclease (endonuclease V)